MSARPRRPTGRKTYSVRYTDKDGRQHQYKIGSANVFSLQQAKRMARNLLAQVIQGSNPQQTRRHLREMPSLAEFVWSKYMPFVETYKSTPHTDEGALRRYVLPTLGSTPLCEITSSDILKIMASMKKRGLGPASIQRTLQVLRHLFNLAVKQWRVPGITINPADGIREPVTPKRNRYLDEEELRRLIIALRNDMASALRKPPC